MSESEQQVPAGAPSIEGEKPTDNIFEEAGPEAVAALCDARCGKPMVAGETVIRGTIKATEQAPAGGPWFAHEACYLRHALKIATEQGRILQSVAQRQHSEAIATQRFLACAVAQAGGRVRISPASIKAAEASGFRLNISQTPEGGLKLVLLPPPPSV